MGRLQGAASPRVVGAEGFPPGGPQVKKKPAAGDRERAGPKASTGVSALAGRPAPRRRGERGYARPDGETGGGGAAKSG